MPAPLSHPRASHLQQQHVIFESVEAFDGQHIRTKSTTYALGSFLGGGAAGTVYEAVRADEDALAIKILHPIGYKVSPSAALAHFAVVVKGAPRSSDVQLALEHVWWLADNSRGFIAAYEDPQAGGALRELPLPMCIRVWGLEPPELQGSAASAPSTQVTVRGRTVTLPRIPPKYLAFLRQRAAVYREVTAMAALGRHENVLALFAVLEHVADSKATLFLVLEMAAGGELFDRIQPDTGVPEATAAFYTRQLLAGVAFCHEHGVVHRDLKPENLLLSDGPVSSSSSIANEQHLVLKIADFGFSALAVTSAAANLNSGAGSGRCSAAASPASTPQMTPSTPQPSTSTPDHLTASCAAIVGGVTSLTLGSSGSEVPPYLQLPSTPTLHRLRSVVGSPYYVAPEVLLTSNPSTGSAGVGTRLPTDANILATGAPNVERGLVGDSSGYDGAKADAWSCGVILYAMLVGALPFGQYLGSCPRFARFCTWIRQRNAAAKAHAERRRAYDAAVEAADSAASKAHAGRRRSAHVDEVGRSRGADTRHREERRQRRASRRAAAETLGRLDAALSPSPGGDCLRLRNNGSDDQHPSFLQQANQQTLIELLQASSATCVNCDSSTASAPHSSVAGASSLCIGNGGACDGLGATSVNRSPHSSWLQQQQQRVRYVAQDARPPDQPLHPSLRPADQRPISTDSAALLRSAVNVQTAADVATDFAFAQQLQAVLNEQLEREILRQMKAGQHERQKNRRDNSNARSRGNVNLSSASVSSCSSVESDFGGHLSRSLPRKAAHAGNQNLSLQVPQPPTPPFMNDDWPVWLFPSFLSREVRDLLCALLDPDPESRCSVADALQHAWLTGASENHHSSAHALMPQSTHETAPMAAFRAPQTGVEVDERTMTASSYELTSTTFPASASKPLPTIPMASNGANAPLAATVTAFSSPPLAPADYATLRGGRSRTGSSVIHDIVVTSPALVSRPLSTHACSLIAEMRPLGLTGDTSGRPHSEAQSQDGVSGPHCEAVSAAHPPQPVDSTFASTCASPLAWRSQRVAPDLTSSKGDKSGNDRSRRDRSSTLRGVHNHNLRTVKPRSWISRARSADAAVDVAALFQQGDAAADRDCNVAGTAINSPLRDNVPTQLSSSSPARDRSVSVGGWNAAAAGGAFTTAVATPTPPGASAMNPTRSATSTPAALPQFEDTCAHSAVPTSASVLESHVARDDVYEQRCHHAETRNPAPSELPAAQIASDSNHRQSAAAGASSLHAADPTHAVGFFASAAVPSVHRSTRFVTAVPDILSRIVATLQSDPYPLPPPYTKLRQTVRVSVESAVHGPPHRAEWWWGSLRIATIQVFLYRPPRRQVGSGIGTSWSHFSGGDSGPLYIVDFVRQGIIDSFLFKRAYTRLREDLDVVIKRDVSLTLLDQA